MEEKETKPIEIPKKLESIDFIYLGVLFLSFIIIVIVFFYSTSFIIKNVNKIFAQNNVTDSHALEIKGYSLLEKKLKLPVNNVINNVTLTEPTPTTNVAPTDTQVTTPTPPAVPEVIAPVLDNKTLTINVLNGARKAGVAGTMITELETAGFAKGTTGDSKTIYPITTILIKDAKKDYTKAIEDAIKKNHPKAITKVNPTTSKFDVVVIVGKE